MALLHLTNANFDETLKSSNPVLVDFWAPWCGPCKMLGPVFEEVSKGFEDKAVFGKVCVDDEGELAKKYSVMSIPTIIVFKGGKEIERSVGYIDNTELENLVKKHI